MQLQTSIFWLATESWLIFETWEFNWRKKPEAPAVAICFVFLKTNAKHIPVEKSKHRILIFKCRKLVTGSLLQTNR